MDRRDFLRVSGIAGITLAVGKAEAAHVGQGQEFYGVLVDTTRCIGCRSCEVACGRENDLHVPNPASDGALETVRDTSEVQFTVVNRFETSKGEVFVKKQCMHCWQAACTAACLTNAMEKTDRGPVVWREERCMGCRYCMISCPFEVPKFEYHSWNPRIRKCTMCWHRVSEGARPACVEACPTDALTFGLKRDLMEIGRVRIYNHPERYVHRIYGEHEVGGTGWMYLSAVPFEEIGFRTDLGETPYPEYTRDFLYGVPLVLLGFPALLAGLNLLTKPDTGNRDDEGER